MTRRILMLVAFAAAVGATGCRNSGDKRSSGSSSCDGPSKYAAVSAPRPVICGETVSNLPTYSGPVYASTPVFTSPPPVFQPGVTPTPANELPMPNETIPPTRLPVAGGYAPFQPTLVGK